MKNKSSEHTPKMSEFYEHENNRQVDKKASEEVMYPMFGDDIIRDRRSILDDTKRNSCNASI